MLSWLCIFHLAVCTTQGIKAPSENKVKGLAHWRSLATPCHSFLISISLNLSCQRCHSEDTLDPTGAGPRHQTMLSIWSLVPLPFLKPAWTSGNSQFMYCWSLTWRILSITLLMCKMSNCAVVWTFFGIALLWDWSENWHFPVLWTLLHFLKLLGYWLQHFYFIIF